MRALAVMLAVLLPAAAAVGQAPLVPVVQSPLGSGDDAGTETRIVLEARDCRNLVTRHRPSADTAYEPGVDARGRPVVPADLLGGVELRLPEVIVIDLLIPLSEFHDDHAARRIGNSEVRVGEVRVEGDRISFNGQPLGDPAANAIAAECRRILARRR